MRYKDLFWRHEETLLLLFKSLEDSEDIIFKNYVILVVHYKDFSIFLQITSLLHKLLEVLFRYQSFFFSKDDISQFHDRDHGKSSKFLGFIVFEPFFFIEGGTKQIP